MYHSHGDSGFQGVSFSILSFSIFLPLFLSPYDSACLNGGGR